MINIQIRGTRSKVNIGEISYEKKENLINDIKDKKISLAELMMSNKIDEISDIYNAEMPIVSNQCEFIATSFNENSYYDDGYSFYRAPVIDLIDKASEIHLKDVKNKFIIVNYSVYFGCAYETEIKNLCYDEFEENHLAIETVTIPFLDKKFIKRITYDRLPQDDLNRSKVQLVKIKSILYGPKQNSNNPKKNKGTNSESEIIIYSEKDFNT